MAAPSANTWTILITAPATGSPPTIPTSTGTPDPGGALLNNLFIANRHNASDTFSVAHVPSGSNTPSNGNYIVYQATIAPNTFLQLLSSLNLYMAPGDTLQVWCLNGYLDFNAYGTTPIGHYFNPTFFST
jgi:hypothetical protein